jgi:hypothetical protein
MPLRTAFHVLASISRHKPPITREVEFLKKHVPTSETRLSPSELAMQVIGRELTKKGAQPPSEANLRRAVQIAMADLYTAVTAADRTLATAELHLAKLRLANFVCTKALRAERG